MVAAIILLITTAISFNETFTAPVGGTLVYILLVITLIYSIVEAGSKASSGDFLAYGIFVKSFWGLGPQKWYAMNELTGFQTSVITSKAGKFEALYLISNNIKVGKFTQLYHSNYHEILEFAKQNLKDLGYTPCNVVTETCDAKDFFRALIKK